MFYRIIVVSLCFWLAACSSSTHSDKNSRSLLLAEPEPTSQRIQMVIARYTHILYNANLKPDERADLHFQRGVAYDAIGLSSLAIIDYNEAIKLKPTLAAAHNSIGVHQIQSGNYLQASESFDATLEINPNYDFALLNRGVALYYGGRVELAKHDTRAFWELDKTDPYRALWLYFTEARLDPISAIQNLAERREFIDENAWALILIDFYLEDVDEADVVTYLLSDVRSQTELNNRLCEAYFYMGKFHAARGNDRIAKNYFKLSLSTNVHEFVEHKYSRIELSNLRRTQLQ